MTHLLALTQGFFGDPTVAKWREALRAGITDAELYVDSKLAKDTGNYLIAAEAGYALITAAEVRVSSLHLPYGASIDISGPGDENVARAIVTHQRVLDWSASKGIGIAVLHPSFEPISVDERADRLRTAAESIRLIGRHARDLGVELAVENLPRTCLGNCSDEMLLLTDSGRSAGVNFDVNHLLVEDHETFIDKVGGHIVSTHISDYDRINERHWMVGDGQIDWHVLVDRLDTVGYLGRFVFELGEDSSLRLGRNFSPAELVARFSTLAGSQA